MGIYLTRLLLLKMDRIQIHLLNMELILILLPITDRTWVLLLRMNQICRFGLRLWILTRLGPSYLFLSVEQIRIRFLSSETRPDVYPAAFQY